MKTRTEVITPKRAEYYLSLVNPERQRRVSRETVELYAASMRSGNWFHTDNGIAISESGELINGQHRLRAIIMSGANVTMQVSTGVPDAAIDIYDRVLVRTVQQQLRLRHGIVRAKEITPITKMIGHFIGIPKQRSHSVQQAMTILDRYEDEVTQVVDNYRTDKVYFRTPIMSAIAFSMHTKEHADEIREFHRMYMTGENLVRDMPAYSLRRLVVNAPKSGGSSGQWYLARAAFSAMRSHVNGFSKKHIRGDFDNPMQYFAAKQKAECRRILQALGEEALLS